MDERNSKCDETRKQCSGLPRTEGYLDPVRDGWLLQLDFGLMVELYVLCLVGDGHRYTADIAEAFTGPDVEWDHWRRDWVNTVLRCLEGRQQLRCFHGRHSHQHRWELTQQGKNVLAVRREAYAEAF